MRYIFFIILSALLFLLSISPACAQAGNITGSPLISKLTNGLNGVVMPTAGSEKTELTLYFKSGSVYESDSIAGINYVINQILSQRLQTFLSRNNQPLNASNTVFLSKSGTEHVVFRLLVDESNIPEAMQLFKDSIFGAKFWQPQIDSALAQVSRERIKVDSQPQTIYNNKVLKEVFRQDYHKLMPIGNSGKQQYIHQYSVLKYFSKYFVANNSILTATGKVNPLSFISNFSLHFASLPNSEFDPETITKIIDFRPMIYSNQYVSVDTISKPEFRIIWQFPGTYSYQQGSFFAQLFEWIFNDKNNYLHVLAAKQGCKKLEAVYSPSSFSGLFTIIIQPDKNKLESTYNWLLTELGRINNTLINESMLNAGKLLFKRDYENLKQSSAFIEDQVNSWPYKESGYITDLYDSVMDINEKEMRRFVGEYIIQNAHFSTLKINASDRQALQVDSFYTDVTEDVGKYIFTYKPNVTDLEGDTNMTQFRNLWQWLKANPDVNIKVNGYADKSEFNKSFSDTIMQFIDSVPTFRKTMPDLISKGYLKPEMMRSLKIIKMLSDKGIALERLSGTSMLATATTEKKELDNIKCDVVLTKMRKVITVKHYHYGTDGR